MLVSQVEYSSNFIEKVPLREVVNIGANSPDFIPNIQYIEGPKQTSTELEKVKQTIKKLYPKKYDLIPELESRSVDGPILLNGFAGNVNDGSLPEDNHIAISNEGKIIAVANSNVALREIDGTVIRNRTLDSFTGTAADGLSKFDPRVIYDPEMDKFIFTCLAGNNSTSTVIILAFSQTNDVNGDWNIYELNGNPRGDNTWSDYPMISVTDTEFFLTMNLLRDNESWQNGFEESVIYQIDKNNGYNGEALTIRYWSDINFEGKAIRNLCPIKYAGENLNEKMYFLSNRNFAIQNDTFFLLTIDTEQTNATLDIQHVSADFSYGAPPNANQTTGALQTNDARVLDGILIEDQIQFVGNSLNTINGFADAYHGVISNVSSNPSISGQLIGGSNIEYGYPGIAWSGNDLSEDESIIVVSHTALDRNPGISAFLYRNGELSERTEIKEGMDFISNFGGLTDRWGDYIGIQRKYNEPGKVWTSGTYGSIINRSFTFINEISSPNVVSNTEEPLKESLDAKLFPNPAYNKMQFSFEVFDYEPIEIAIFNVNGQLVELLYKDQPKKLGLIKFSFNVDALETGLYLFSVKVGNDIIHTDQIIKN